MKSHNTSTRKTAGFTLIEILIVVGIFALLASIGMVFSFDSYRGYLFRSEHGQITQVIAKARNLAANNFNEAPHGVHFEDTTYTLFIGSSYDEDDDTNTVFERNTAIQITGPDEIVFEQLSGSLDSCDDDPCTVSFSYGGKTKDVTISDIGEITW